METKIYEGYTIKSTPSQLHEDEENNFAVNGIIEFTNGGSVTNVSVEALEVPENEHAHKSEARADKVFIKYAKKYIYENLIVRE